MRRAEQIQCFEQMGESCWGRSQKDGACLFSSFGVGWDKGALVRLGLCGRVVKV